MLMLGLDIAYMLAKFDSLRQVATVERRQPLPAVYGM